MLLLCGCVTHNPQPSDTKFDESQRNWISIFQNEIRIAVENGDVDAYHFFMQELIMEKTRLWKKRQNELDNKKHSEKP